MISKQDYFPFNMIDRVKKRKLAKKISKEIDRELCRERHECKRNRFIKAVVTGHSQSGKSSFIEHLKLQTMFKGDLEEAVTAKDYLRSNCLRLLTSTVSYIEALAQLDLNCGKSQNLGLEEYNAVMEVLSKELNDKESSVSFQKDNEAHVLQNYLLSNHKRILHPSYSISFEDFLVLKKSKFKHDFVKDFVSYKSRDGLEPQMEITHFRKPMSCKSKPMSHFDDSDIIIFCLSLKTFCQSETLDSIENQLEKDILYFKKLADLPYFYYTDFVLVFTHVDIFKEAFEHFYLPDEFIDFVNSRALGTPGPDEFCELVASKFKNLLTNDYHREMFHLKLDYNEIDYNEHVKTIDLTLLLITTIFTRCKGCKLFSCCNLV